RIFDFGDDQTGIEGSQGSGSTYLFLTPRITDDGGRLVRVAYQRTSYPEVQLDATRTLPSGKLTHVAVTFDATTTTLALYIDGGLENSQVIDMVPMDLSAINDINDWLGRSQYAADPQLGATIEEFRIYDAALSAAQIQTSFSAGPNPVFLAP
ncbi:MAG TPA: LamG domain-containing protein, partial [Polyangiaceae bacterium]|nr:LamG domain-containing protein [Polyangiaceae bacterium]